MLSGGKEIEMKRSEECESKKEREMKEARVNYLLSREREKRGEQGWQRKRWRNGIERV